MILITLEKQNNLQISSQGKFTNKGFKWRFCILS